MELHGIVGELLAKRGLTGKALEAFLDPSLKRIADARKIPGLSEAADVIIPFVRDRGRITVFADYDCDGVCAGAILVTTLRRLGADVSVFIPDRQTEGYGMTPASVARMISENPDTALVLTVDCGIKSAAEVKTLKDRGIAVVVTDHHTPPEDLPVCDALIDYKIPSMSSAAEELGVKDLCGAGVAFFLANIIAAKATEAGFHDGSKFGGPLLVLAGLATVVDIVPLVGQNRILVANAIAAFRSAAPTGLLELLLRAERRPVDLTSRDFGFLIGPRINAAGRMASAMESFDLIMESDREAARGLALKVDNRNNERKTVENRMTEEALERITEETPSAVVVGEESGASGWHSGVCGIVASRIMARYGVPVAVAVDGHGSIRAPEGYDVHEALTECADFLERFGGHKVACGFTVKEGMSGEFASAFKAVCAAQCRERGLSGGADAIGEPDMWLSPDDLTMELHGSLKRMEPFGEGNPEPVFGLRDVAFSKVDLMGMDGKHAAFSFIDRRIPRATWWNRGGDAERIRKASSSRFDMTFTLDVSDWGPEEPRLELRIREIRRSVPPSALCS